MLLVPAIILGRSKTALGAMRCLARRGITVMTATIGTDLATESRYYRPAISSDGRRLGSDWTTDDYDILAAMPADRYVLIPCSDITASWVADIPAELRTRFPSSNPSGNSLNTVQDKRNFAELCRELDIPHPRYYLVESDQDLAEIPIEESSDWFFKPSNSHRFMAKYAQKGARFTDRAQAESLLAKFCKDAIPVMVQEYVSGGASEHYFIDGFRDRCGIIRARMARRRLRIYPRDFGNSAYCHQVPIEDVNPAWQSLERILEHLDYRGIFSAEFKYDATLDEYRILEINARVWLYVEFAAWCGIDVCHLAYLDALQQEVPRLVDHRPRAGCVNLYHDFKSIKDCPPKQRPRISSILRQWLTARKLVFCWGDPKPFLVWVSRRILARLKP